MALILWPLLLAIPISFVLAGPVSSASLTPYITNIVPTCAQSCLQSFIADNYPTQVCTAQNLNCLCITPSTSGYTLGEAALTCLYTGCKKIDTSTNQAYGICRSIPGAQPNVHPTLQASSVIKQDLHEAPEQSSSSSLPTTAIQSTSLTSTTRKSSPSSTKTRSSRTSHSSTVSSVSSTTSSSKSSTTHSTRTTADTSTKDAGYHTMTTSTAASTSTAPPPGATPLTKPQIAGVVVACIGASALSLGFCFFLFCYRRKRKRPASETSLIGDKIIPSHESSPIATSDAGEQEEHRPEAKPPLSVVTPSHGAWQMWQRNTQSNPQGIGLALAPDATSPAKEGPSPLTPYSHRTHSQLLPDRPHYSVFPHPTNKLVKRQSQTLHPPVQQYAPEKTPPMTGPRFPSAMDTSQANLQTGGTRSMSDPFYNDQQSPVLEGYRGVPYTPWTNPSNNPRRPPSVHLVTENAAISTARNEKPTIPVYNEPLRSNSQRYMGLIDRSHSKKNPPRKKSASSSHYTRFSNDSGTSFEDMDDDSTPAKYVLSPVTEMRSPPHNTTRDATPPLPIKSTKRSSHIVNRPRPVPRRPESTEAADVSEKHQPRDVTKTAKYKILVSPGLQSLDESLPSSPQTPRTPKSDRLPRSNL